MISLAAVASGVARRPRSVAGRAGELAAELTRVAVGRSERLGYNPSRQRRLYHFRNRHGFSDVADAVFDRLWSADGLSWADLQAACAETAAGREPAPA